MTHIIMNDCAFNGSIPASLLRNGLQVLHLHNNQLTGPIPSVAPPPPQQWIMMDSLRLDNNYLECPEGATAQVAVLPWGSCDVSGNLLCRSSRQVYTPACAKAFHEFCRITPCRGTQRDVTPLIISHLLNAPDARIGPSLQYR
jgi:hypothetical protein